MLNNIGEEIKIAMKSGDKFKLSVLRMLKSALQNETINKKSELTLEESLAVIKKQVKVRKDSLSEFEKYNKTEECNNLKKEIELLNVYLPEELTEEQINAKLDEIFGEINPTGMKDMGQCMKMASESIENADMSLVSSLIKDRLSKL